MNKKRKTPPEFARIETKVHKKDLILDKHQIEACDAIDNCFEDYDRCLVKMFCGTGKTRVALKKMIETRFSVIVFPILALIQQFQVDYLQEYSHLLQDKAILSVCSKDEVKDEDVECTTDVDKIVEFIELNEEKIVMVTYASLEVLLSAMQQVKEEMIDLCIFDEAHLVVGQKAQDLIFPEAKKDSKDTESVENEKSAGLLNFIYKTLFLTATPRNENGIVMFLPYDEDDENYEIGHCGPLAYEYSHRQAVEDGVCRDFDIAINFYSEEIDRNINKAIARVAFDSGNRRILTFHTYVDKEHENLSSVKKFQDDATQMYEDFVEVWQNEFPEKAFSNFDLKSITANTKNRREILDQFDNADDDQVQILASCRSIGMGVDLKNANAVCFIDPKQSEIQIVQNIGRILRNPSRHKTLMKSTVILPIFVDLLQLNETNSNDHIVTILKENFMYKLDFRVLLDVLTSLDYFRSTSTRLNKGSEDLFDVGSLCKFYYDKLVKGAWNVNFCCLMKKLFGIAYLQVISAEVKETWEKKFIKLREWVATYGKLPGSKIKSEEKELAQWCSNQRTYYKTRGLSSEKIHKLESIALWYWNFDEIWRRHYMHLCKWITSTGKLPSGQSKNQEERQLAHWCYGARKFYKRGTLSANKIKQLESIPFWYWEVDRWNDIYKQMQSWIEVHDMLPKLKSKDINESKLGAWCGQQRLCYKKHKLCEERKKKLESLPKWSWCVFDDRWSTWKQEVSSWVNFHQKIPSMMSKDSEERRLGGWCSKQREDFKTSTLADNRIKELELIPYWYWRHDLEKLWNLQYSKLNDWVILHKKLPSHHKKDKEENSLGQWCSAQRKAFKKLKLTSDRIEKLELIPNWFWQDKQQNLENLWNVQYSRLYEWLNTNKKLPSHHAQDKEERSLGYWLQSQKSAFKEMKLSSDRVKKLESLPYWYWEKGVVLEKKIEPPKEESKTLLTVRSKQSDFRALLLKRYPRCVISGHSAKRSEAAHIRPYSEGTNEEKYDLNNGLILDSGLHKLFDRFLLTINPETCQVEITESEIKEDCALQQYVGKFVENISEETKVYLTEHYNTFQKKNSEIKIG